MAVSVELNLPGAWFTEEIRNNIQGTYLQACIVTILRGHLNPV
jgi:hypothetical protein